MFIRELVRKYVAAHAAYVHILHVYYCHTRVRTWKILRVWCVCVCISSLVLIHLHSSCTLAALMHASLRTVAPANGSEGSVPKRVKRGCVKIKKKKKKERKKKRRLSRRKQRVKIHITLVVYIPLSFLFIYKTPSLSISLSLSLSLSLCLLLALTHWRMLTHQVPWLPSMGWCHFRWHHHAVYVCLCPPPTHHHSSSFSSSSCSPPSVSFLRGKVLFDTHPLYPDHRPNCLASTSGEGGRGRESEGR